MVFIQCDSITALVIIVRIEEDQTTVFILIEHNLNFRVIFW